MHLHLSPHLALFLCVVFIFCLFWIDYRRNEPVSQALWIPVIWMAQAGSRRLEQWFSQGGSSLSPLGTEGSPLQAFILSVLIFAGLRILSQRKERFGLSKLIADNRPLFLLLGYYALAVFWSDFPFVSFKRYIKLLGVLTMALVILTDTNSTLALRTALCRCGYVLLPLSIVLAKYFRCGVTYDVWTGERSVIGLCVNKNMLGQVCLVLGLFFLWDILLRWKENFPKRDRLMLIINTSMLLLAIQLLLLSHSATSLICLGLGSAVLLATKYDSVRKRIGLYIVIGAVAFLILDLSLDMIPAILHAFGRDTTLTGRTYIWKELMPMAKNSLLFGSGYESFWTGSRVLDIWQTRHINEAHNGYLEIVLNTGLIGLFFFSLLVVSVYRRCKEIIRSNPEHGRFFMTFFITALLYNFTEAAFKGLCLMFFLFVTIAIKIPETDYGRSVYVVPARASGLPDGPSPLRS